MISYFFEKIVSAQRLRFECVIYYLCGEMRLKRIICALGGIGVQDAPCLARLAIGIVYGFRLVGTDV